MEKPINIYLPSSPENIYLDIIGEKNNFANYSAINEKSTRLFLIDFVLFYSYFKDSLWSDFETGMRKIHTLFQMLLI